ncbi:MAG: hypothetical protein L6Q53_06060 [Candidatus Brocadia sinica]|nr:hypothetical protein [Candidatus Brocadia sinica]
MVELCVCWVCHAQHFCLVEGFKEGGTQHAGCQLLWTGEGLAPFHTHDLAIYPWQFLERLLDGLFVGDGFFGNTFSLVDSLCRGGYECLDVHVGIKPVEV